MTPPNDGVEVAESIRRELSLGVGVERFASGSVPVFKVGEEYVVKLFPALARPFFATEVAALNHVHGKLSIPTPRVVASGERGAWLYVVMTRLTGCSLTEAWPALDVHERRKLMGDVGVALSELHRLPIDGLAPLTIDWPRFIAAQRATARERQVAKGLVKPWLDRVEAFLADHLPPDGGRRAVLHTEIMREHLLAERDAGGWRISGLVDFEPAMIGAPEYDLSSIGIFVACAEPGMLRVLLDAYGVELDDALRLRIMAYSLLHRYSNLRWYIERLAVPESIADLEALALHWFRG